MQEPCKEVCMGGEFMTIFRKQIDFAEMDSALIRKSLAYLSYPSTRQQFFFVQGGSFALAIQ